MGDEEDLSPKEIALRLDSLLGQYMSHLDKSLQLRENLSQVLKNGHFNISKAKYSMGPLAVSQYKYPSTIHPSSLIKVNSGSADLCYSINKLLNTETNTITTVTSQRLRSSSLNSSNNNINKPLNNDKEEEQEEENNGRKSNGKSDNEDKKGDKEEVVDYSAPILMGDTVKDSPSGGSSLRRRKTESNNTMSTTNAYSGGGGGAGGGMTKKKVKNDERSADDSGISSASSSTKTKKMGERASTEKEKVEKMLASVRLGGKGGAGEGGEGEESDDEEEVKYKNPLNWFGVLVPQNLRQAQSEFSKAVELIVEIANVVHQMEVYQQNYNSLLARKNSK